jgi:hypothetical protein
MSRRRGREKGGGKFERNQCLNFELRITLIRFQKHKVGRTFSIHETLSTTPPVGNPRKIQIF